MLWYTGILRLIFFNVKRITKQVISPMSKLVHWCTGHQLILSCHFHLFQYTIPSTQKYQSLNSLVWSKKKYSLYLEALTFHIRNHSFKWNVWYIAVKMWTGKTTIYFQICEWMQHFNYSLINSYNSKTDEHFDNGRFNSESNNCWIL